MAPSSFAARGGGSNIIWIDPEHDLVVVIGWITSNAVDGVLQRILAAVRDGASQDR